jgi:hypothetical protein
MNDIIFNKSNFYYYQYGDKLDNTSPPHIFLMKEYFVIINFRILSF